MMASKITTGILLPCIIISIGVLAHLKPEWVWGDISQKSLQIGLPLIDIIMSMYILIVIIKVWYPTNKNTINKDNK